MRLPNFFILGSGRCGTSSLQYMLRQHPQVFMTNPKEPSFFCSYFQIVKNPIDYFNLFKECKDEIAIGEKSHVYFSNPETPEVLHTLFPNAKFILILRNPTNRCYSMYNSMKKKGNENRSFEEALKLEDKRYKSDKFFKNCPHYFWNFMYVRSSYYHIQLKRYLDFYDINRFFFLNLYEFSKNPYYWIEKTYDFLELDSSFIPISEHRHKTNNKPMDLHTRNFLDIHFEETRLETERIAGKNLYLDKL